MVRHAVPLGQLQATLAQLSVFRGGFTLEATEAVEDLPEQRVEFLCRWGCGVGTSEGFLASTCDEFEPVD